MRQKHLLTVLISVLLFCSASVSSRTIKGVEFPEHITIDGKECPLVGVGIRKKLIINVYLGAFYMSGTMHSANDVIHADVPKRIHLHIVYNEIAQEQLVDAWNEGFEKNAEVLIPSLKNEIAAFNGYFDEPAQKGDTIILTYVPGKGTEVSYKNIVCGTIPGYDFMEAVFSIWFGPEPPSGGLKEGMLGED